MRYEHRTCTILQHLLKCLAPLNVKGRGKVLYQKPRLKSMGHGVYPRIVQCISTMCGANSTWMEYNWSRKTLSNLHIRIYHPIIIALFSWLYVHVSKFLYKYVQVHTYMYLRTMWTINLMSLLLHTLKQNSMWYLPVTLETLYGQLYISTVFLQCIGIDKNDITHQLTRKL